MEPGRIWIRVLSRVQRETCNTLGLRVYTIDGILGLNPIFAGAGRRSPTGTSRSQATRRRSAPNSALCRISSSTAPARCAAIWGLPPHQLCIWGPLQDASLAHYAPFMNNSRNRVRECAVSSVSGRQHSYSRQPPGPN